MTRSYSARGEAAARADLVEQEPVVLAIDHQHDRLFVDRIAGGPAHARAPIVGEERAAGR